MSRLTQASGPAADHVGPDVELALLADDCLNGAECLYDPYLHEGPEDPAIEPPRERAVREQVAAELCAICPVHEPCFEYAARVRPQRGVWAGRTAAQIGALADMLSIPRAEAGARSQLSAAALTGPRAGSPPEAAR